MHFDQREQSALRAAGLTTDDIAEVSDAVAERARRDADRLRTFFDREVVYSDLDLAHSSSDVHEHDLAFVDLYTHAEDIRGYVRFDSWGAWVAGGRVLRPRPAVPDPESNGSRDGPEDPEGGGGSEGGEGGESPDRADEPAELVELTLGPTVHDRVRFAADPEEL